MWPAETVFMCALALLGRTTQSFPTTELIDKVPSSVSPLAAAYVNREGETRIVLVTSTSAFSAARRATKQCGELDAIREIAGVLAHEEWHVRSGPDEEGAYDAQLTALASVGANQDSPLYHKVMRAKLAVLAAAKRAAHATVLARGTSE